MLMKAWQIGFINEKDLRYKKVFKSAIPSVRPSIFPTSSSVIKTEFWFI
jgi:hypothetical protein